MLASHLQSLLQTAIAAEALQFGEFTLKSGRQSPYFFNAGKLHDGQALYALAQAYAHHIMQKQDLWHVEALFGPAYKGIPLVAAVAVILAAEYGISLPWAFNRKEAKNHGEGGMLVGANLRGKRVLILDDVLTAGTAVRESLQILQAAEALPCAALFIFDRQEALQEGGAESVLSLLAREQNLQAEALFSFQDVLQYLNDVGSASGANLEALQTYRQRYGVRA